MEIYLYPENLYVNDHNSFICNSWKLATNKIFFISWMVKQTVIHPYHGILFSNKKGTNVNTHNSLALWPQICHPELGPTLSFMSSGLLCWGLSVVLYFVGHFVVTCLLVPTFASFLTSEFPLIFCHVTKTLCAHFKVWEFLWISSQ